MSVKIKGLLEGRMKAVTASQTPLPIQPQELNLGPAKRLTPYKARAPRAKVYKKAELILESGQRLEVIVRDLFEGGARVDFYSGSADLAGRLLLKEPSLAINKWATLIWKSQNSAGLRFES